MSSAFLEAANLFVWSAWGEIGLSSTERRTFEMSIDLEPLIRLSAVVDRSDPRLRSEVASWLDAFRELVSQARLKRIGGEIPQLPTRSSRSGTMSGEPSLDVESVAAVQLRMRSSLGVSARAEIVRQLVLDGPRSRRSTAELAQLCGYTKRNVEKALESLERGGWVARIIGGTTLRWMLVYRETLTDLFEPLPDSSASFMALAEIVERLVALDAVGSERPQTRSAATRQLLAEMAPSAGWGDINLPRVLPDVDAWDAALAWTAGLPATAL